MQIIERLGWMLFHSLWQILLIACIYGIVLWAFRLRSASVRYALGCIALVLMSAAPVVTFVCAPPLPETKAGSSVLADASPRPIPEPSSSHDAPDPADPLPGSSSREETLIAQAPTEPESRENTNLRPNWRGAVRSALPVAVAIWLAGVLVLSLRPVLGMFHVMQLRRQGLLPVSVELKRTVRRIARRMGLGRQIDVAVSSSLYVPVVVGITRPLLLLSPAAVVCLSPRQLEAVVAHELAHIRRYDYFVNLLQTLLETLLFYHPAMWWVSRRIREERENCCDDLAVAFTGDRLCYAEMLLTLEKSRPAPRLAPAANGGSLLKRVRRLVFPEDSHSLKPGSAFLGGMMMVILSSLIFICLAALSGISLAADDPPESPSEPSAAISPEALEQNNEAGETPKKAGAGLAEAPAYDADGFTPLHRAAIGGRTEEVSSLIDDEADVNAPHQKFQGTPLQYAAARGHKDVVELLIAAGASVDSADSMGRTPLMWAASEGRTEVVKVLLANKADANAKTNTGWTPFRYAVKVGDAELIKLFKEKVNFNELDEEGFSLLHRMASGGHEKSVQALLDAGADVNVRQKTYQGTPLQYAASGGHDKVVEILIKGKATIDEADKLGRTPLMWAAMYGKKKAVEVLLAQGANIHARTESGWTALRYAQEEGHKEVADLLVGKGAGEKSDE